MLPEEERRDKKDCIELKGYKNGFNSAIQEYKRRVK